MPRQPKQQTTKNFKSKIFKNTGPIKAKVNPTAPSTDSQKLALQFEKKVQEIRNRKRLSESKAQIRKFSQMVKEEEEYATKNLQKKYKDAISKSKESDELLSALWAPGQHNYLIHPLYCYQQEVLGHTENLMRSYKRIQEEIQLALDEKLKIGSGWSEEEVQANAVLKQTRDEALKKLEAVVSKEARSAEALGGWGDIVQRSGRGMRKLLRTISLPEDIK